MKWMIVLLILMILVIFVFTPVKVRFTLTSIKKRMHLSISVFLLNWRIYQKDVTKLYEASLSPKNNDELFERMLHKAEQLPAEISDTFKQLFTYKRMFQKNLSTIHINKFSWQTEVGLGEASATGIVIGNIWSIKGMVTSWISHQVHTFPQPNIVTTPCFSQEKFQTELICIGTIRLGKAIYAIMNMKKIIK